MVYNYVRDALPGQDSRQPQPHLTSQILIEKFSQKVRREVHRMKGFIRFQKTGPDQYLALIAPQNNVLPLIRRHFESRFADQKWIIYDTSRNHGLCYDCCQTQELRLDTADLTAFGNIDLDEEQLCQTLWPRYFTAVNIPQRNNP